jgi:hypothetical protein
MAMIHHAGEPSQWIGPAIGPTGDRRPDRKRRFCSFLNKANLSNQPGPNQPNFPAHFRQVAGARRSVALALAVRGSVGGADRFFGRGKVCRGWFRAAVDGDWRKPAGGGRFAAGDCFVCDLRSRSLSLRTEFVGMHRLVDAAVLVSLRQHSCHLSILKQSL